MKFEWKYRYVEEGQLSPDRHGRWAIDCYVFAHIEKSLPKYKWAKEETNRNYLRVRIATIVQKGTENGDVPSLIHKFCTCTPEINYAGNTGFSQQTYFYSNDIDELKQIVEENFIRLQSFFKYLKK